MAEHEEEAQEYLNFGAYLQAFRVKKGLSIKSVCHETKLSRSIVESIEAGERSALPEDLLFKSFIRSLAEACGADSERVVSIYLKEYPPKQETDNFYSPVNRKRTVGLLFLLLCLSLLVAGAVFFF